MSHIIKITITVVLVLLYGEHFGMSLSGLLTFGGIGGLAVGMAGKDILSNFFSRDYVSISTVLSVLATDCSPTEIGR
ncbi:hypothetical protein ACNKHL_10905 [Shigella flexneri]